MDKLPKYTIANKKYIKIDELLELKMIVLEDCKNSRRFIDKQKVPKKDYIYAKYQKGKWLTTRGKSYKLDKVFVTADWINTNISGVEEEELEEELIEQSEETEEEIQMKPKILTEPGLIELKKSEKIKDCDGNIIEIEVRGTREYDNCYFLVKDVAEGFGMEKLRDTLIHRDSKYENGIHYLYFSISDKNTDNIGGPLRNKKVKKVKKLYLTYIGLLKVLFSSRNNQVDRFIQWATETLFTAHLGTIDQKSKLTAKFMGVSLEAVKEIFDKTSSKLPVIYLTSLGKVKDLRSTLKIGKEYDDEDIVYKGGETTNLAQRMEQHQLTLGKLPGVKLYLKWYNYIDPQYSYKGETELFQTMDKMGFKFDHPKYKELLIFSKKDVKVVLDQYTNISNKSIGHVKEISEK